MGLSPAPNSAALEEQRQRFLNALNVGGGLNEATAYLDAGGDIDLAIVPMIEQSLLHYAAIHQRIDLIEMLARRGADLEVFNAFGMSALHLAVMHEVDFIMLQKQEPGFPCARRLVELGASLDAMDNQGRTPREFAKMYGPAMLDLFDEEMK